MLTAKWTHPRVSFREVDSVSRKNFLLYLERLVSNMGGKPQESRCLPGQNTWEESSCRRVKHYSDSK